MSRKDVGQARADARADKVAHDEEKLARREESLQRQLVNAVDRYAAALELFDQWQSQGVRNAAQLDKDLEPFSVLEKLAELRRQIEMRTIGCGWVEFQPAWTFDPDEKESTIRLWRDLLVKEILPHEKRLRDQRKLPKVAVPPQLSKSLTKTLGTADADALRLEAKSMFKADTLLARAEKARERREAAGISDSVEAQQPREAPAFDTKLVGKRLEICWPYKGEEGKTTKIWASGVVKRVADGLTDKASPRARKILPAGALLWAWDADKQYEESAGEQWMVLLPARWNKHVQYAWRYDPCELCGCGGRKPSPREPLIDAYESDEEFIVSDDEM